MHCKTQNEKYIRIDATLMNAQFKLTFVMLHILYGDEMLEQPIPKHNNTRYDYVIMHI